MSLQHQLEAWTPAMARRVLKRPFLPMPATLTYDRRAQRVALWDLFGALVTLRRHLLLSVQVIVVCRETDEVLGLAAPDYLGRFTVIQGLVGWRGFGLLQPHYEGDPIEDALRELVEEAVTEPPPAAALNYVGGLRDGPFGQLMAFVYALEITAAADKPTLRHPTSEGAPAWVRREQVDSTFHDRHVARLVHAVFERAPLPRRRCAAHRCVQ